MAPNALIEVASLDDDAQYAVTLARPITGLDGRLMRPGAHVKSIHMSGAVIKRLAADNPGAISGAVKAT